MFDDIHAYFHENAVAAYMQYKEAKENPVAGCSNDLRLIMNAATALYHFREHLPQQHSRTRKQLSMICPYYDLLGDIVNAGKHKDVTRGTPQVDKAENIYEQVVVTEYKDEKGRYLHHEKTVDVDLVDGTSRDIFEILTNVINMWLSELVSIGIMPNAKIFSLPTKTIPARSEAGTIPPLNLKITRGLRFSQRIKMQRYNYDTCEVETIDLTGCKIEGAIFKEKPKKIMDVLLADNETGEKYCREITLSEEQENEYHSLTSEDDLKCFMSRIAEEQGVFEDISREIEEKQKTAKEKS